MKYKYAKGFKIEWKCILRLRENPDIIHIIRSAGSHSLFDIYYWRKDGTGGMIQCKSNYISPKERNEIARFIVPYKWTKEIWLWKDYGKEFEVEIC